VRRWRRHWCVDPNTARSPCGVEIAIPARGVLDVDCKRCQADPEWQYAAKRLREQAEWRALSTTEREKRVAAILASLPPRNPHDSNQLRALPRAPPPRA
jgi:hypothetical protein